MTDRVPHGTVTGYASHHCRCEACTVANRTYKREYAARYRHHGRSLIPADQAQRHLERLTGVGLTMKGIERITGVSDTSLSQIVNGRTKHIHRETEDRILGVTLDTVPGGNHWVPVGAARTIVANLVAAGFSEKRIAAMLGYRDTSLKLSKSAHIYSRNYRRLEVLYRLLAREVALPPLEEVLA